MDDEILTEDLLMVVEATRIEMVMKAVNQQITQAKQIFQIHKIKETITMALLLVDTTRVKQAVKKNMICLMEAKIITEDKQIIMEDRIKISIMKIVVVVHIMGRKILHPVKIVIQTRMEDRHILVEDLMEAVTIYSMLLQVLTVQKMAARDVFPNVSLKRVIG